MVGLVIVGFIKKGDEVCMFYQKGGREWGAATQPEVWNHPGILPVLSR